MVKRATTLPAMYFCNILLIIITSILHIDLTYLPSNIELPALVTALPNRNATKILRSLLIILKMIVLHTCASLLKSIVSKEYRIELVT